MTKYILHGGNTRENNPDNNQFFAEMTTDFAKGKVKILLCYFSREDNEIDKCFKQDKDNFIKNSVNQDLEFEIANPNLLSKQLNTSDIFYIRGGETEWLLDKLKSTANLSKFFENKTIVGSSAGAYALCKYYQGSKEEIVGKGLGILNFKIYCHYKKENNSLLKRLLSYKEKLPLIVLQDYKWQVIYQ